MLYDDSQRIQRTFGRAVQASNHMRVDHGRLHAGVPQVLFAEKMMKTNLIASLLTLTVVLLGGLSCVGPTRYQANTNIQVGLGANVPVALAQINSIISARAPDGVEVTADGFPENGRIHVSALGLDAQKTLAASTSVADTFVRMSSVKAEITTRPTKAQRLVKK